MQTCYDLQYHTKEWKALLKLLILFLRLELLCQIPYVNVNDFRRIPTDTVKIKRKAGLQNVDHFLLYSPTSQCCGSGILSRIRIFSIPDPNFFEFRYFNPEKWFLNTQKYDPGCSSRIESGFFTIPDPRSRSQKGTGSRIRQHCYQLYLTFTRRFAFDKEVK